MHLDRHPVGAARQAVKRDARPKVGAHVDDDGVTVAHAVGGERVVALLPLERVRPDAARRRTLSDLPPPPPSPDSKPSTPAHLDEVGESKQL